MRTDPALRAEIRLALAVLSLVAYPTVTFAAEPSPAVVGSEFIYEKGTTPSCHASTLAETEAGTLVAAWFGGTAEGKPDVGIWCSRRENGKWSVPVEVATGLSVRKSTETETGPAVRFPCWNPVLFQPSK